MPFEVRQSILHEERTLEDGTYWPGVVHRVLQFEGAKVPGRDVLARELRRTQGDETRELSFQGDHCTLFVRWVRPVDVPFGPERARMNCAIQGSLCWDWPHDQDLLGVCDWHVGKNDDALVANGWASDREALHRAFFNGYYGRPATA